MSKVIHKFPLDVLTEKPQTLNLHKGAQVLSAGLDGNKQVCIWVLVDKDEPLTERRAFMVLMTGDFTKESIISFIGTVKASEAPCIMCHVFEVLNMPERIRDYHD